MEQMSVSDAKGFLRSLYDFKFTSFITGKVIRVIYILIVIIYSLFAAISFFELIRQSGIFVPIAIIAVPIGYLLSLTMARIALELIMVIFRIGDDLRMIRDRGRPATLLEAPNVGIQPTAVVAQPTVQTPAATTSAPGWYEDPHGQARVRYWDGTTWTEHTQD